MDDGTEKALLVGAIPAAFLISLMAFFAMRARSVRQARQRCLSCLADTSQSAADRAQAADGLAEYAGSDNEVQAALQRAAAGDEPLVSERARVVLGSSIRPLSAEEGCQARVVHASVPEELHGVLDECLNDYPHFKDGLLHYERREDGSLLIRKGERSAWQGLTRTKFTSANGQSTAEIIAAPRGRRRVEINGRAEGEYSEIDPWSFVFSPDGQRWAYAAKRPRSKWTGRARWIVVANGKESRSYRKITDIALSPDGGRLGYTVLEEEESYAVVDGKRYAGAGLLLMSGIVFSPDGRHFATWANKALGQRGMIALDGQPIPHDHEFLLLVGFRNPTELVAMYATERSSTFTEDVSDMLWQRQTSRFSVGLLTLIRE